MYKFIGLFLSFFVASLVAKPEYTYFVVLVPSYNNHKWIDANLDSIRQQKYPTEFFTVVYINDCSTDDTGLLVDSYIEKYNLSQNWRVIHNTTNYGACYNIYQVVHGYPGDAVIVLLDGDDWFYDDQVLTRLNAVYSQEDAWFTYGQFIATTGRKGFCAPFTDEIIDNNLYRHFTWRSSHLRTFYADLFKHVPLTTFLYGNEIFKVTWDLCFIFPMLEMAGRHVKFIKDLMYVYNLANPISDSVIHAEKQLYFHHYFANNKKSVRLEKLEFDTVNRLTIININESKAIEEKNYTAFFESLDRGISPTIFNIIKNSYKDGILSHISAPNEQFISINYDERTATMEYDNHGLFKCIKEIAVDIPDNYILLSKGNLNQALGFCVKHALLAMQRSGVDVLFIFGGAEHPAISSQYHFSFGTPCQFIPKYLKGIFIDAPLWGRDCSILIKKNLFTQIIDDAFVITSYNSVLSLLSVAADQTNLLSLITYI